MRLEARESKGGRVCNSIRCFRISCQYYIESFLCYAHSYGSKYELLIETFYLYMERAHVKQTYIFVVHKRFCWFHNQWSYTLFLLSLLLLILATSAIFDVYLSKYNFLVSPDPGRKNWDSLNTPSLATPLGGDCSPVCEMFRTEIHSYIGWGSQM